MNKQTFLYFFPLLFILTGCLALRLTPGNREDMPPKHEFRGAWIQTAYQEEYKRMTPAQMKADFIRKLDILEACRINAIIFQVRPEADAFYPSNLEPWSRFFTGTQGKAPQDGFDLMQFLIEECHKRNMEFHAWLNPYRAGTEGSTTFAASHIIHKYPGRFVRYNKQILFDPGQPQNRRFIANVVKDIVSRYDVDAIHLDDYFYPYPASGGIPFPDDESFKLYGQGSTPEMRNDWRRQNVNLLVSELSDVIHSVKPWVRFGISPFGIYRNKKNTPADDPGSQTNGLQSYDDLYADILLWLRQGWIDYVIPQLYWEIAHPSADYATLIRWWDQHTFGRHLYIGQDVDRTMKANQLAGKMQDQRQMPNAAGHSFWPANEILWNNKGVADSLKRHYHRYPALLPAYTRLQKRSPGKVKTLQSEDSEGLRLHWNATLNPDDARSAHYFVIYRFDRKEKIDLSNPARIIGITRQTSYRLNNQTETPARYVVTAVNRFHNESKGVRITIKP